RERFHDEKHRAASPIEIALPFPIRERASGVEQRHGETRQRGGEQRDPIVHHVGKKHVNTVDADDTGDEKRQAKADDPDVVDHFFELHGGNSFADYAVGGLWRRVFGGLSSRVITLSSAVPSTESITSSGRC